MRAPKPSRSRSARCQHCSTGENVPFGPGRTASAADSAANAASRKAGISSSRANNSSRAGSGRLTVCSRASLSLGAVRPREGGGGLDSLVERQRFPMSAGASRRGFLKGALAAWALPSVVRASPDDVRLSVRGPFPDKDLRARAQLLSRLGYQGIELGPEYLEQPADAILGQLEGTGIVVSAIVGSIKLLEPDPAARAAAVELDKKRL